MVQANPLLCVSKYVKRKPNRLLDIMNYITLSIVYYQDNTSFKILGDFVPTLVCQKFPNAGIMVHLLLPNKYFD